MRGKIRSKIINSQEEKSLRDIMQNYDTHSDRTYRLVVDGCTMRLAQDESQNWFEVYSNMEVNPVGKKNQGLFSAMLSGVNFQKRQKKNGVENRLFVKEPNQKRFKIANKGQNEKEKNKQTQKENKENNFDLPLESNLEAKQEPVLNNFTLSFNEIMEENVGKIKHQFIQLPTASDSEHESKDDKQNKEKEDSSTIQNPYAKMADEESRESLRKMVDYLNQNMKQRRETQVREIREEDHNETEISVEAKWRGIHTSRNQIVFDLSLECLNV